MEPSSRSLYVTLLSNTSKPEFPHNTPASFKVRLPYPLRVKNWQVGVAGVYLPGPPNVVSHAVSSHPVTSHPTAPLTEHRQSNLYKGSTNQRLVRMYSRANKGDDVTRVQEITSTMEDADMPEATTGVTFMKKVVRWLQQDRLKKLFTGYIFGTTEVDFTPRFEWKDEAGVSTLWILNDKINIAFNKPRPYLGFNLVLAETMGWIKKKEDQSYELGPNLLMFPHVDRPKAPKIGADGDKNQLFTFSDYVHVNGGMAYLSMVMDWQFVNLDEAYAQATTHVYVPPKVLWNRFRWIMDDESVWIKDGGISSLGFVNLEGSPHYWKKKTVGMTLTKSGNKYEPKFGWLIGTTKLSKTGTYRIIVEIYTTDKILFDKTSVTAWFSFYVQNIDSAVTTHVHEYLGTHMAYYHRLVQDFRLTQQSDDTSRMFLKVTMDGVPSTYPATLTDQCYVVVYGYNIAAPWQPISQVTDVYDGHPVIRRGTTTTSSSSTTQTTTKPTHQGSQEKQKKTTVTPATHGDHPTRSVHLYCNAVESSIVGTQITNFFRDLPYKDEPIRWEPEHVQYHRVRGDTVEIVEVEVAETNGELMTLNPAGETQVTLHFQA